MGFLSGIGGIFNDITGVSSSAKQNNAYQKEFAQNAHQWEMQDLQKAGLNPALTANGGSGASAGGSGGSAGSSGINPFTMVSGIADIYNNTKATNANSNLADAQAINTLAETKNIPQRMKNETMSALANKLNAQSNETSAKSNADYNKRKASGKGAKASIGKGGILGNIGINW